MSQLIYYYNLCIELPLCILKNLNSHNGTNKQAMILSVKSMLLYNL